MPKGKEYTLEQLGVPKRSYRFDWEPPKTYRISSSAVFVHLHPLKPLDRKSRGNRLRPKVLLVQQMDHEGYPYSIPAGAIEEFDNTPVDNALRELDEETGLSLSPSDIELMYLLSKLYDPEPNRRYALYAHQTDWNTLDKLGTWKLTSPHDSMFGSYYLSVDHARRNNEIGNLAVLDVEDVFARHKHSDINLYRQDIWWSALNSHLEGLKVI